VRGYLLDNNHVSALYRKEPNVVRQFNEVPHDWQIRICCITLGEIEFGHLIANPPDVQKQDDFDRFLTEYFISGDRALLVSVATRIDYAELLSRIWQHYPPRVNSKIKTETHLNRIGVDVNDLWTVSIAREHNLIFATQDEMKVIREVATDVEFDNWFEAFP
jgi:predicted nucleic acid-binding protein